MSTRLKNRLMEEALNSGAFFFLAIIISSKLELKQLFHTKPQGTLRKHFKSTQSSPFLKTSSSLMTPPHIYQSHGFTDNHHSSCPFSYFGAEERKETAKVTKAARGKESRRTLTPSFLFFPEFRSSDTSSLLFTRRFLRWCTVISAGQLNTPHTQAG